MDHDLWILRFRHWNWLVQMPVCSLPDRLDLQPHLRGEPLRQQVIGHPGVQHHPGVASSDIHANQRVRKRLSVWGHEGDRRAAQDAAILGSRLLSIAADRYADHE